MSRRFTSDEIQNQVDAVLRVLTHLEDEQSKYEDEWRRHKGNDLNDVYRAIHPWMIRGEAPPGVEKEILGALSENQLRARLKKAVQDERAISFKQYGNLVKYLTTAGASRRQAYRDAEEAKLQAFRDRLDVINEELKVLGFQARFEGGWKPKPSENVVITLEALEKVLDL